MARHRTVLTRGTSNFALGNPPSAHILSLQHFMDGFFPMSRCPPALFPSDALLVSQISVKLFYGLIVAKDVFVSYADKNQLYRIGTTRLASTLGWNMAMSEVVRYLGQKHRRFLTCCIPVMKEGSKAGFIGLFSNRTAPWYVYTEKDDEKLLQALKEELGLPKETQGVWYHAAADYDFQELLPLPDLDKLQEKRARRLQKLDERAKRAEKRKKSSDTLRC
ncbi:hypothetical protein BDV98DRAFT_577281 [Pterulicium gracile]|uniref:Uncharacterized protein n=1 Tax=Pterulicium gracile TaxID=1884261 RepID=A0A5C3Q1C7_9AGAR|nr:hypothetical protein BDV98DRAFT_577281 [Pterula gracilis]